jgi:exonuclease SbcC
MRNFMCYRNSVPPLSFEGIHLACLAGENGSGKSALIDAMTWALWGKARASSDDDLIAAGKTEMEVDLEFDVGKERYRIIRRRSRPKKVGRPGQTVLEFQLAAGDGFKPISGDGKIQTQQRIIDTLHMNYETFINSAYLRQGHADEFTIKRPAERKEVLAQILGLDFYDTLEERARELARGQEAARAQLESAIGDITNELAQRPAYKAELAQAQEKLEQTETMTRAKEASLNNLRQQKEALQNKKAQLDELETRLNQGTLDLERWQEQVGQHRSRIREYEATIARRQAIEEGFAQLAEARKTNEELDKKLRQSVSLEKARAQQDKKIQDALNNLKTEHAVTRSKIDELELRAQRLPELRASLSQTQEQLRELMEPEAALKQKEATARELQAQTSRLEAEIKRLEKEISETEAKLDLLSSQPGAKCPLCETELTIDSLKLIAAKYTQEKQAKAALLGSARAELAQKQTGLKTQQQELSQMESRLNAEKTKAQSQAEITKNEIAAVENADKQLAEFKNTLADIEQRLAEKDFAAAEQKALATIEAELSTIGYNAERHEQIRQQLHQLEPYDQDKRRLDEAERLIPQEREALSHAEEVTQERQNSLDKDRRKKEALVAELTSLPQLINDLAEAEASYRTLEAQRSQAQEAVGQAKEKLKRLDEMATKKKEKEAQLIKAAREEKIYKELAEAFGKRGIQAMLIETAFPEMEAEANRLLSRLTDGRMTVKFETQRLKKTARTGEIMETLDINIDDGMGTRNYEMFSGGEAFRINFAIRIALSKLLARRAGAPLRTLIIDEGFGTQDNAGLEKLKEAINSIKDDFDKLLVVTHVEELRDAFPSHIDVVKNNEGSTISVS